MPFSQLCGASHGLTEALSGSSLAQPEMANASETSARRRKKCAARYFISGVRMCRSDFVAFDRLTQFPTGNDIGDTAIFFNTAKNHFGNQLALTADE